MQEVPAPAGFTPPAREMYKVDVPHEAAGMKLREQSKSDVDVAQLADTRDRPLSGNQPARPMWREIRS